eukprot:sb/3477272/
MVARLAFVCLSIYVSALLAVRLQSGILSIVVVEHLDMITTRSDSLPFSLFLSLSFSLSPSLSCHDETSRSTTLSNTASHVTLSTISDTMITSADEASQFDTLRTKSTLS